MHSYTAVLWRDSTVALSWIQGDPNRWKTFVCNRTTEILQYSTPSQWRHCTGTDNPADHLTRTYRKTRPTCNVKIDSLPLRHFSGSSEYSCLSQKVVDESNCSLYANVFIRSRKKISKKLWCSKYIS
ncbi:DUF1758 domain-containing protein [Trichonephila clavata]|uniref:DUF1758 domain-containing protein n=1 Tax=Trichonephila clavata TaxID=2740835 RepID=A0A8X6L1P1_TRICU|nr:DUF1758 domain-containing protein [Trichonephila clavata]